MQSAAAEECVRHKIGIRELRFSAEELRRAEAGEAVRASIDIIGDGGRCELTFEARNPGWQGFELAPAGSASASGSVASVSRVPGSMELWYVGANGSVQDRFWYEGAKWQGFERAAPGSASTTGPVSAVSRIPGSMETWYVGTNRSLQDRFWYQS
ncbi:hypothetical protein ABT330_34640 [Streptomyces sp. NPDC000658]|uniref:hypothetical protein n=1 Tax=Streptomyces sp. NPDC000658 TaxID=3154266 RepID=UPI00331FA410